MADFASIVIGPEPLSERGYQTTFYQDFSIAEKYGMAAVQDTYERVFNGWHTNVKYLTELTIVLNHKSFDLFRSNNAMAKLYDDLWRKTDQWAMDNLKDENLEYYLDTTD